MTKLLPKPGELIEAVKARDMARVKLLLEQGADPNERDSDSSNNTALHLAVLVERSGELAKMLIEHGAEIDATNGNYDTTPLMYAARSNLPALAFLIESGAALEQKDSLQRTALNWASAAANKEAVKMLKAAPELRLRLAEEKAARITAFHDAAAARQAALNSRRPKVILKP